MKERIWGIVCIAGFIILLGTVGANDAGTITTGRYLLQVVIGAGLTILGGKRGGLFE